MVATGGKPDAVFLADCCSAGIPASGPYYAVIIKEHARTRLVAETVARLSHAVAIDDPTRRDQILASLATQLIETAGAAVATARGVDQILNWGSHLATDYNAVEMLTDPLLGWGQQVALVGNGKVGKSLLAMEWALSLATGQTFLGKPAARPLRVMYIDQENGHPEIQRRLRALGYTDPAQLANLTYVSFPPFRPLDTAEGAADLLRLVDRYNPDVLFLDTISRMVAGEENSADTWLSLYRLTLMPLKSRGVATVRLDHLGKDSTRGARGSSSKSQDVDHVWELTEQPGQLFRLRRTYTRTGIGDDTVMLRRHGTPTDPASTWHESVPWGPAQESKWVAQREMCQLLADAGVPIDAGRLVVRKHLAAQGVKVRNDQLGDLVRFRRGQGLEALDDEPEGGDLP
jgi:hypothetical protein